MPAKKPTPKRGRPRKQERGGHGIVMARGVDLALWHKLRVEATSRRCLQGEILNEMLAARYPKRTEPMVGSLMMSEAELQAVKIR